MGELTKSNVLNQFEIDRYNNVTDWFNENLQVPTKFSRSSSSRAENKAISWFKDSAEESISKMREVRDILEVHGIVVYMIRTSRPGYIVYEDEIQIVAEPFADTNT